MSLKFYGLKTCDTCRKALKALEESGTSPDFVDVRADGIPPDELSVLIAKAGHAALVNTRSTTWRGLDAAARSLADTPEGAARLLAGNPTLMKRPVIVADGAVHVGWTNEVQAALLD